MAQKAQSGDIVTTDVKYEAKNITPIKQDISKIEDPKAKIRALYERDSQPVRGVFRRHDGDTAPLEFTYKKYEWEKPTKYKLYHGQVHTVPWGVAKHLDQDCKTPIYGHHDSLNTNYGENLDQG